MYRPLCTGPSTGHVTHAAQARSTTEITEQRPHRDRRCLTSRTRCFPRKGYKVIHTRLWKQETKKTRGQGERNDAKSGSNGGSSAKESVQIESFSAHSKGFLLANFQ